MNDYQALMKACEREPGQATPLLVFADWAQGEDMPQLELGLRWMAGRGLRPFKRTDVVRRPWQWVIESRHHRSLTRKQYQDRATAVLPRPIFECLLPLSGNGTTEWREFSSFASAVCFLADALDALRHALAYPEPEPIIVRPANVLLVTCQQCGIARASRSIACPVCTSEAVAG